MSKNRPFWAPPGLSGCILGLLFDISVVFFLYFLVSCWTGCFSLKLTICPYIGSRQNTKKIQKNTKKIQNKYKINTTVVLFLYFICIYFVFLFIEQRWSNCDGCRLQTNQQPPTTHHQRTKRINENGTVRPTDKNRQWGPCEDARSPYSRSLERQEVQCLGFTQGLLVFLPIGKLARASAYAAT